MRPFARKVAWGVSAMILASTLVGASTPLPSRPTTLRDSPGYYPPTDPESASVRLGRRTRAPRVSIPFEGGATSLDALGRALCWAAHHDDADTIAKLSISEGDFRRILWREFPQSRPATGMTADDAWQVISMRFQAGIHRFLSTYRHEPITFVRFDRRDTVAVFRNFRVHNGLTMVVRNAAGEEEAVDFVRGVAERRGRFKLQGVSD